MNRRSAIVTLTASILDIASLSANAQAKQRSRPARIAILDDAEESARRRLWADFRNRLKDLGHAEGATLIFEQRWANGDLKRLPELAAELVALKPDIIVAVTTTGALAAKQATARIPIVAIGPADPVKSGLVASLGRPGGNVTGISPNQSEIAGKWLELVREIAPGVRSLAYLTDVGNPGEMLVFRELELRSKALGLEVRAIDGVTKSNVEQAFALIERDRVDAIIVATTAALLAYRRQIIESAARLRLPAVYARSEYPEDDGLLSYGAEARVPFLRAAEYVDRILKGAHPSNLPFEMASAFTLVVNIKTARALGVAIPQSVLARADHVIR